MDLYGELSWRGLVYDATEGVRDVLAREKVTAYIGFDPTAPSLHVGSLLPMIALAHLQRHGHTPIAVVGGGTGLIGDPSGKTVERTLLTPEKVAANVAGIRVQLERFLDFDAAGNAARLVDNGEWLTRLGAVDFMRDVGKHFGVGAMLARDSVKRRLESDEGISYTEFSYSLLQAYDFLELFRRYNCTLQMGGSDQWGNITAGMDLIRRTAGGRAHGLVLPLITTASGVKFGKSEAGTVWLDPDLTSPHEFYQFWLHVDDRDAARYVRFFTFQPAERVAEIEQAVRDQPEKRVAQRELAREMTRLVHGEAGLRAAEAAAEGLFSQGDRPLTLDVLRELAKSVAPKVVPFDPAGWRLVALLTATGVTASKGEATRLIRNGGIYLNGVRVTDEKADVTADQAVGGEMFVVRRGKQDTFLIKVER